MFYRTVVNLMEEQMELELHPNIIDALPDLLTKIFPINISINSMILKLQQQRKLVGDLVRLHNIQEKKLISTYNDDTQYTHSHM